MMLGSKGILTLISKYSKKRPGLVCPGRKIIFHVTGTQYISTDKVQSQTLNTGGTAEIFSPWAISPGRFLLYSELWELLYSVLSRISAAPFCPCISQYTSQKFICLVCICRSRVDLSAWKSALFRKISNSLRSDSEIFLNNADFQTLRVPRPRNRTRKQINF